MSQTVLKVEVELSPEEAADLAAFLKRAGFPQNEEAATSSSMFLGAGLLRAGQKLRIALAGVGVANP